MTARRVGYYVTVLTTEWLGRKWIQIQGFLLAALFRASLAHYLFLMTCQLIGTSSRDSCRNVQSAEHGGLYRMLFVAAVFLQFWCQRVSSSPSRVVTVRLILHLQNNILLSRRSVPYQVQGYRTRHVRCERKGGRHHLCARVQPAQPVHRHACRSVEYVRFLSLDRSSGN